ncbi:hypothetical protein [Sphingobium fuliginis]|uniref:hypothetical protein n=1 Tax=Sphingobium fuliginis (strain ATCC 27551) TaxID=336203 RepID=UPI0011AF282A|nr:hypothetical protein [Sphingobium fuliginis]
MGAAHIKQPVSDADAATECAIVAHEFIEDDRLRSAGETLRARLASDPHIIGWGRKGGEGEPVAVPATSWERGAAFRRGSANVLTSVDGSDLWYSDLCIEGRGLLMAFPAVPKDGPTVAPRREQIVTRQQKDLLTFFGLAERSGFMRGGHRQMNEALLIEEYERWVSKDRARGKAMGRTSFQKWRNRFDQGERWA